MYTKKYDNMKPIYTYNYRQNMILSDHFYDNYNKNVQSSIARKWFWIFTLYYISSILNNMILSGTHRSMSGTALSAASCVLSDCSSLQCHTHCSSSADTTVCQYFSYDSISIGITLSNRLRLAPAWQSCSAMGRSSFSAA